MSKGKACYEEKSRRRQKRRSIVRQSIAMGRNGLDGGDY